MSRLLLFAHAHAWPVLAVLALLSALAVMQLDRLEVSVSQESLFDEGGPEAEYYRQFLQQFGGDDLSIVFIKDADLATPETLRLVRNLQRRLAQLPFVIRTDSLFSIPYMRLEGDLVKTDPYLADLPDDVAAAQDILARALESPFVRHNLLSDDRQVMAINVSIDSDAVDGLADDEVVAQLNSILDSYASQFDALFQVGAPAIRQAVDDAIVADQKRLLPLAMVTLLAVLIVMSWRLSIGIVPLLTAAISVSWLLGMMAALGLPLSVITAIVPALVIIIGSTEDVHLLAEFMEGKRQTSGDNQRAVQFMARNKGFVVFLTATTTFAGFLSISTSSITLLREFGLVAAAGLTANFVATVLFVPAFLRVAGRWVRPASSVGAPPQFLPVLRVVCRLVHHHAHATGLWLLGFAVLGVIGATQLKVNNHLLGLFDEDAPIRQQVATLQTDLSGLETFQVVLDGRIEGTFLKARYLAEVRRVQDIIAADGRYDLSLSIADYFSVLNGALDESDKPILPMDDDVIAELNVFISPESVSSFVSSDFSKAVILVRHKIADSSRLNTALRSLEQQIRAVVSDKLTLHITGHSVLSGRAADQVSIGQAASLALMLVIIFLVIGLLFVNARVGFLAIVPNLFPIAILFGIMGFEGIALDTGTAMIAAIAIGLCVDDTMHFMIRYNRELGTTRDEETALSNTLNGEALAIFSTSFALAAGFLVLASSSFPPIANFGALSALVMLFALVADFLITPILLRTTRLTTLWDLLSVHIKEQLVRECRLFRGMNASQVKKLILLAEVRSYADGDVIMNQGDASREMFILLSGEAEIRVDRGGGREEIWESRSTGSAFGQIAMLTGEPRLATGIARGEVRLLAVSPHRLEGISRLHPRITSLFYKNLATILGTDLARRFRDS